MRILLPLSAATGVWLLYSRFAFGWRGLGPRAVSAVPRRDRVGEWLTQSGLDEVRPSELLGVVAMLTIVGAGLGFLVFGGFLPSLAIGVVAAFTPVAAARNRRRRRFALARESWPRMIEEIRLLTGSVGQSIPQALLEVGRRGPEELRPAFEAAQREWLISTDFGRTVTVLKQRLADATADAACETLLIAHEVGGTDVDQRLAALAEDRIADVQGRKDARSKQAGVRFARTFVIIVPMGMALVGLTIGSGRTAYQTPIGQVGVFVGLALMGVCWAWASRLMRLPEEDRVFYQ